MEDHELVKNRLASIVDGTPMSLEEARNYLMELPFLSINLKMANMDGLLL